MAEEISRSCYTCLQHTSDPVAIVDETVHPKNVESKRTSYRGTVLTKHFWFELEDLLDGVLCQRCWSKIEDFHQFYCEIEEAHEEKLNLSTIQVKEEDSDGSLEAKIQYKQTSENQEVFVVSHFNDTKPDESVSEKSTDDVDYVEEEHLESEKDEDEDELLEEECQSQQVSTPRRRRSKKLKHADRIARDDELIAKYCNMHCDQCSLEFSNFTTLQMHSSTTHQRRAYVFCCDRKFNTRTRLFEHVQWHMNPECFQCDLCKRNCMDSEGLKRHKLKVHTPLEERPFKCDRCAKAFVSEANLNCHRNYHLALETKEHRCQFCDKHFGNSSLLKAHVKNQHASTYEFVCDTCAKGFNQRGLFLRHLQEHAPKAPEEQVQCPICFRWLLKVSMNKHILRHNSPTYRCDLCGKESPNVLAHKSHIRFAHSEAKFTCNICEKVFKRALTLKEHVASHSGEVLYTCPYCPKTFNSNANMHAHRKKMHHHEWLETKRKRFAKKD